MASSRLEERRRMNTTPEVPTSSMADIAFLLIIFFMLTAVFTSRQGLRFGYPEDQPQQVQPQEAMLIRIEGEGRFAVAGRTVGLEGLQSIVAQQQSVNPGKPVIIRPLPEVPYSAMIDVFDLLKQMGVENISIPTSSEVELWKQYGIFEQ